MRARTEQDRGETDCFLLRLLTFSVRILSLRSPPS
nr:MAG TPA: hypothetical protein [Bacteriophage sp.]DAQ78154.1 MAG TPA: hypothetical protein [Caudoviricetes sp.]DAY00353.1 MAG TPA: hypothetical protein [Caudoviricetes sp.]